ncbi:MAG: ShlB/FhaC/HecB family hemolysin secretion/activation protein [Proteobacteria bacterium]|uniref:ShlB/FhaC/HecB family hemolysin secretion/activation protein n=1 Tax=Candidatus Avisuccinivibrio stercorigallinarum TaxID=2840704 RepID=A0A9D9GST6_9GAMM|nr:ShlB/FhaC/HecB family hemolysin secretion/activation protein [Candidatus Avisuccinivibrio stercorigallinarum]
MKDLHIWTSFRKIFLITATAAMLCSIGANAAPENLEGTSVNPQMPQLRRVEFSGQIKADPGLIELTEHYLGRRTSIELIENLQREVSRYCQQQGFLNAQTLLPAGQNLSTGTLQLFLGNVLMGKTTIDDPDNVLNASAEHRLFKFFEEQEGQPVNDVQYNNQLLKLLDLGMFHAEGMLQEPRYQSGVAGPIQDLTMHLTPTRKFGAVLFTDNQGIKSSGRYRFGWQAFWYSPTGNADALGFLYARTDEGQNNFSLDYQIPINSHPTLLGTRFCWTDYDLGYEYKDLGAEGSSWDWSLWLREPLYRTLEDKLYFEGGYRYRDITDEYTAFDLKFEKHTHALWLKLAEAGFKGRHDYSASVQLTAGRLYNDDEWDLYDEGWYKILFLEGSYGYQLNSLIRLGVDAQLQLSPDDVDSSEEFTPGGGHGVSGYDSNVLSGDSGGLIRIYTEFKPFAAEDFVIRPNFKAGFAKNKDLERQEIYSVGLELEYEKKGFFAKVSFDAAVGNAPYDDLDKGKVWFEAGVRF